ncbi:MAG: multidrug ABC transporter ATP-binding protein [Thermoprotei archaeon]|nr:MAG: multidrug ABC transporter ATP-binding protein [Thermoprotei archaeon]RLE96629.1 MAG: multidrug ABC transporter ATP-binding protein [Thermoprotei archaeon]
MSIVVVENLVKVFEGFPALRGVSFAVEEGEVFGLIGPNGAGKTTTFRILATLLLPTSGRVEICGLDVVRRAAEVRRLVSYLPEEAGTYRNLTGYEYLKMMAEVYFGSGREAEEALELGLKLAGLGDRVYDKMKTYSRGMKRRIQVARALMVRPRVAVLDEPTTGLDVIHSNAIRRVIREYARKWGVTVLLSSHNMSEVEGVCDRIAVIHRGRILACGTPDELREEHGGVSLEEVLIKLVGEGA